MNIGKENTPVARLWKKADNRNLAMHLVSSAELWDVATEQGHLSIEVAFDAILVETGSWTIDELGSAGHNLRYLAEALVRGKPFIHEALSQDEDALRDFRSISSAWRMQYRYKEIPHNENKMREFIPIFERLFQWISSEFRKSVSN